MIMRRRAARWLTCLTVTLVVNLAAARAQQCDVLTVAKALPAATAQKCETQEEDLKAIIASHCRAVALLIGVGDYQANWNKLPNAARDVDRIAQALPATFDKMVATDCDREGLRDAIIRFGDRAKKADVAIVYISAHGFEYGGRNFIVPRTTTLPNHWSAAAAGSGAFSDFLTKHYVDVTDIIRLLAPARFSIVFLDACRDDLTDKQAGLNAFGTAVVQNGGQLVVYSTAPGNASYDSAPKGTQPGPFADELAKRMIKPHQNIGDIVIGTTEGVEHRTTDRSPPQRPYTSGSAKMRFYFLPAETIAAPAAALPPAAAPGLSITQNELRLLDGAALADLALQRHSIGDLEAMANGGSGDAAYLLGFLYHYGVGVARNPASARQWLERSTSLGSLAGMSLLAYTLPRKKEVDRKRAYDFFSKATEAGYPKAAANLGHALIVGSLGVTDKNRGWALIHQAAKEGYFWAIEKLYTAPDKADRADALSYMDKLSATGNRVAANWLCVFNVSNKEYAAAFPLCRSAAQGDQTASQGYLAILYAYGWGTSASSKDAQFWKQVVEAKPLAKILPNKQAEWIKYHLSKIAVTSQ